MSFEPINASLGRFKSFSELPRNLQLVFAYFLENISFTRVPVAIPMLKISLKTGLTYDQIRYAIKKLISLGLLEKWTATHPKKGNWGRTTYYRIKTDPARQPALPDVL